MVEIDEDDRAVVSPEPIDDEIAEFVRLLQTETARYPDRAAAPLRRQREIAEEVRERWRAGGPEMARREDVEIDGPSGALRLRLLTPAVTARPGPALIYVHGGGFTSFSLDTHDRVMREYAAGAHQLVIGVDYSLSPEVKFPVALHEVMAACDWVWERAPELGLDSTRLAIGGDSAGANLAVSTCLALRDRGDGQRIGAMILNYGFFGPDLTSASHQRHGADDMLLTNAELQYYIDNYLGDVAHRDDPRAWPILADLHDLPPSFHAIAECDPLVDSDLLMVEKLRAAGNAATSVVYKGATHSFLEAVSIAGLARKAFDDQCAWLRATLGGTSAARAA